MLCLIFFLLILLLNHFQPNELLTKANYELFIAEKLHRLQQNQQKRERGGTTGKGWKVIFYLCIYTV
jgi:hypothetical protein